MTGWQRFTRLFSTRSIVPYMQALWLGWDSTGSSGWKFQRYADEAYNGNWVVGACLAGIASAFALPRLYLESDEEEIPADEMPPALAPLYGLLCRPNPDQADAEFRQQLVLQKYCGGTAYVRQIGAGKQAIRLPSGGYYVPAGGRSGNPELWLLRPDYMQNKMDGGTLLGWKYDDGNSKMEFSRDDVLALRFANPLSPWDGRSPLKAAEKVIDTHNSQIEWNRNLTQNSAVPAGVMLAKGLLQFTNTKEREDAEQRLRNDMAGARNAGKTLFLPAEGFDYKQLGIAPKDMDWNGGQGILARAICGALNYPSPLIGDPDSRTYSNYQEARRALYTDNVLPQLQHYCGELNHWLVPRYESSGKVKLCFDTSHIDALTEDETAKYERAILMDGYWTIDEIREYTGKDPLPNGEGAKLKQPPPSPFDMPTDEDGEPVDEQEKEQPVITNAKDAKDEEPPKEKKSTRALEGENGVPFPRSLYRTLEARAKFVDDTERRRQRWIAEMRKRAESYLDKQARSVVKYGNTYGWITPASGILNSIGAAEEFTQTFKPLVFGITVDFGEAALAELKLQGINFNLDTPGLKGRIAESLARRSELINQSSADKIQAIIDAAQAEGKGSAIIAERLQEQLPELSKSRAVNIARTETTRTATEAAQEGYAQAGVKFKEWVSARDGNVRDDHVDADGQVVGIDDSFDVGGESLSGPGDGSPENACNCRCVIAPLYDESDAI